MSVSVHPSKLKPCGSVDRRHIWHYRTEDHILDVMTRPNYFSGCRDRFSVGDVILVDCPGYLEMQTLLGYPQKPIPKLGGGVLQVEAVAAPDRVAVRILGRGLRRFVKSGENAMSGAFELEASPAWATAPTPRAAKT